MTNYYYSKMNSIPTNQNKLLYSILSYITYLENNSNGLDLDLTELSSARRSLEKATKMSSSPDFDKEFDVDSQTLPTLFAQKYPADVPV